MSTSECAFVPAVMTTSCASVSWVPAHEIDVQASVSRGRRIADKFDKKAKLDRDIFDLSPSSWGCFVISEFSDALRVYLSLDENAEARSALIIRRRLLEYHCDRVSTQEHSFAMT